MDCTENSRRIIKWPSPSRRGRLYRFVGQMHQIAKMFENKIPYLSISFFKMETERHKRIKFFPYLFHIFNNVQFLCCTFPKFLNDVLSKLFTIISTEDVTIRTFLP